MQEYIIIYSQLYCAIAFFFKATFSIKVFALYLRKDKTQWILLAEDSEM